jgi:hypothetical protein
LSSPADKGPAVAKPEEALLRQQLLEQQEALQALTQSFEALKAQMEKLDATMAGIGDRSAFGAVSQSRIGSIPSRKRDDATPPRGAEPSERPRTGDGAIQLFRLTDTPPPSFKGDPNGKLWVDPSTLERAKSRVLAAADELRAAEAENPPDPNKVAMARIEAFYAAKQNSLARKGYLPTEQAEALVAYANEIERRGENIKEAIKNNDFSKLDPFEIEEAFKVIGDSNLAMAAKLRDRLGTFGSFGDDEAAKIDKVDEARMALLGSAEGMENQRGKELFVGVINETASMGVEDVLSRVRGERLTPTPQRERPKTAPTPQGERPAPAPQGERPKTAPTTQGERAKTVLNIKELRENAKNFQKKIGDYGVFPKAVAKNIPFADSANKQFKEDLNNYLKNNVTYNLGIAEACNKAWPNLKKEEDKRFKKVRECELELDKTSSKIIKQALAMGIPIPTDENGNIRLTKGDYENLLVEIGKTNPKRAEKLGKKFSKNLEELRLAKESLRAARRAREENENRMAGALERAQTAMVRFEEFYNGRREELTAGCVKQNVDCCNDPNLKNNKAHKNGVINAVAYGLGVDPGSAVTNPQIIRRIEVERDRFVALASGAASAAPALAAPAEGREAAQAAAARTMGASLALPSAPPPAARTMGAPAASSPSASPLARTMGAPPAIPAAPPPPPPPARPPSKTPSVKDSSLVGSLTDDDEGRDIEMPEVEGDSPRRSTGMTIVVRR